jgi:predicted dehydrogenase
MKFVVVGLGSMGKRRVRNLQALGHRDILGFDPRADRRAEAQQRLGISTADTFDAALRDGEPDALVVSTPPRHHMTYAERAVAQGLGCFIEASVVDSDRVLALAERSAGEGLVVAPSCTMRYFPGPIEVKRLIEGDVIGAPLFLNYQTGQYLPDWHPWEPIGDYYVSERDTGGCREIVPFELTWLNDIFGHPEPLRCVKAKLSDMPADIDDVYTCTLRYPGGMLATMTVEVLSRPVATRVLRVTGAAGQIVFDADEGCVRYATTASGDAWTRVPLSRGNAEAGYINPEEPYIAEMADFVRAVESRDPALFPNTLHQDWQVLQLLEQLESLS